MSKHIEMIIDYIVDGDDFQYNDNHGRLIRCKDCKHNDGGYCDHGNLPDRLSDTDYCSRFRVRLDE